MRSKSRTGSKTSFRDHSTTASGIIRFSPAWGSKPLRHQGLVVWWTLASVGCLFISAPCRAWEAWPISPFEGVEALRIEVLIGAGLEPEEESAESSPLFGADSERIAAFEESLKQAVKGPLEACGVRVSDEAADVLHVMLYGRAVLPSDPRDHQVTLLEVRVLRDEAEDSDCLRGEEPAIKTVLGFVPDGDLEKSLISQVVAAIVQKGRCSKAAP